MIEKNKKTTWFGKLCAVIGEIKILNWKTIYAFIALSQGVSILDTTPLRLLLLPGAICCRLLTVLLDLIKKRQTYRQSIASKVNNFFFDMVSGVAILSSIVMALVVGGAFSFITPLIFFIMLSSGFVKTLMHLFKDMKLVHQAQQLVDKMAARSAMQRIRFEFANLTLTAIFIAITIFISILHIQGSITPFFAGLTALISVTGTMVAIHSRFKNSTPAPSPIETTPPLIKSDTWENRLNNYSQQLCKKRDTSSSKTTNNTSLTQPLSWIDVAKHRKRIEKLAVVGGIQELVTGTNYLTTHYPFNDLAQKEFFEKTLIRVVNTLSSAQKSNCSFEAALEALRQIVPNAFLNRWGAIADTESLLKDAWQNRQFWVHRGG